MYLLAFYAFHRVGEITKTTRSNQHYLLPKLLTLVCNPQKEDYLQLTIPHYKHSKNVATSNIKQNTAQPALCPLKACQTYLLIRSHHSIEEPLFSFMDGTLIWRKFFKENLQQSLAFCGRTLVPFSKLPHWRSQMSGIIRLLRSSNPANEQVEVFGI